MTSEFLKQLAGQLRKGRSPACGRSIQQILPPRSGTIRSR